MNGRRIAEVVLEFLFAISVVAAILAYAEYGPVTSMPAVRWWGFAGETVILFGYMLRATRQYWRYRRFWVGYIAFLGLHSLGYIMVLMRVEEWPLMWFVIVGFGEWVALAYVLDLLLRGHVDHERLPARPRDTRDSG